MIFLINVLQSIGRIKQLCLEVKGLIDSLFSIFQRQPSYLLPFFCMQVFDFCVNLLGAVGAISYIPELKLMLKNNVRLNFGTYM